MAETLCSTMPAMTGCSRHRGTKVAMIFSRDAATAGLPGRLRLSQAHRQTASKARSSRPLTRMTVARGKRQSATPTSSNRNQEDRAGITYVEVAENAKVRRDCCKDSEQGHPTQTGIVSFGP